MQSPIKLTWKSEIWSIILILITVASSFYFYAHFPERVVTHWGFMGEPNGWSSRAGAAFGLMAMVPGMYLMFLLLPLLDPKKERYVEFAKVFHLFKNVLLTFFAVIYLLSSLYNIGYPIRMQFWAPWLVGLLMIFLGNYLGKIKPNWFVGIRTPWTLSSENVWYKTHRVGGWAFILFGVCIIISPNLPPAWGTGLFTGGAIVCIFGTILYSYILYLQERKNIK
jgi:uncharacterized membrane protein